LKTENDKSIMRKYTKCIILFNCISISKYENLWL